MKGFLGIDVSKGFADFVLLNQEGKKLEETLQLDDTRTGHNLLTTWLQELPVKHSISELYCGLESTGGLENNWYAALKPVNEKLAVYSVRLNPSVVVNASKAELNTNVTDSESARNIASYLRRYADKIDYGQQDNVYSAFRSLHTHIQLLIKQKTQIINELKVVLYSSFPEMQRYCKKGVPTWVLIMLKQYPTAEKLTKAKLEKLEKIPSITNEKAMKLIASAKASIGSRQSKTDEFIIANMAEEILEKETRIKSLKKHLAENCNGQETKLLETIKGIGSYSAASIMIQIEDISRFKTPKELASYFGLHPVLKESGDKKIVSRMSKRGRPAMRATLYMCAHTAVLYDGHLKEIYARHRAKGKAHRQAIGVVMHKMLRIVWGVLNSAKPYDCEIDKQNQIRKEKPIEEQQHQGVERKRRLQKFDQDAPISRMAYKKRKAHAASQSGETSKKRDLEPEPSRTNILKCL
jgi:transposase